MGKLIISMAMFNSYVKLPEGNFNKPQKEIHQKRENSAAKRFAIRRESFQGHESLELKTW